MSRWEHIDGVWRLVPVLLLAGLALPVGRQALEAALATHMLVQLPLLALAGAVLAGQNAQRLLQVRCNEFGATGLVLVVVISLMWMSPRAMDSALADVRYEIWKFISLPAAGAAAAVSYPRAPALLRGVLMAHAISGLAVMGWAYFAAPVRLCNSYLLADQKIAGLGLLTAAAAISAYVAVRLIVGGPAPSTGTKARQASGAFASSHSR